MQMLRSHLEYVADVYARMLATTERKLVLDVSAFVVGRWKNRAEIPPEIIQEFQRRRCVITYYVGGMAQSVDPNALLWRPPVFYRNEDRLNHLHDMTFLVQPYRAEWDEYMSKPKGKRIIRYGPYTHAELVDHFWARIKVDMKQHHHRDILHCLMLGDPFNVRLDYMTEFAPRIAHEMLNLWATPYEPKTWDDSSPLTHSKERQQPLLIELD